MGADLRGAVYLIVLYLGWALIREGIESFGALNWEGCLIGRGRLIEILRYFYFFKGANVMVVGQSILHQRNTTQDAPTLHP